MAVLQAVAVALPQAVVEDYTIAAADHTQSAVACNHPVVADLDRKRLPFFLTP